MGTTDYIVLTVILLVLGGAITYIVKEKKSGKRCIGCPHSGSCSAHSCNACQCSTPKDADEE